MARGFRLAPCWIAIALQHLALIAALDGDTRCAARLLGYVNARFDQLEVQREPTEQWVYEMLLATLRESLDEHQVTSLTAEGGVWGEEQAVEAAV